MKINEKDIIYSIERACDEFEYKTKLRPNKVLLSIDVFTILSKEMIHKCQVDAKNTIIGIPLEVDEKTRGNIKLIYEEEVKPYIDINNH